MSEISGMEGVTIQERRKKVVADLPDGRMPLTRKITELEVALAAKDIPIKKSPGPDLIPSEIYRNCPTLHKMLAELYTKMIEMAYVPRAVTRFFIVPLEITPNNRLVRDL